MSRYATYAAEIVIAGPNPQTVQLGTYTVRKSLLRSDLDQIRPRIARRYRVLMGMGRLRLKPIGPKPHK